MQRLKVVGLALVALFAMSAVAASAASAHEFIGKPVGGTLEGHALNNQEFTTNGGTVVCKKAATTGEILQEVLKEEETQLVKVTYTECTAFGQPAKVTPAAEYLLSPNEKATVHNTITITVEGLGGGCKVTVEPIVKNEKLSKVTYENVGTTKLKEISAVENITYKSSGGFCGTSGENGKYKGNSEVEVNKGAGSVQWK